MSYNGSGTFLINTAGQPVVANTVISATVFNALTADLATGLSTAITKDGQTTITANIPFASNKITGLGAGTLATDAAQLGQVQSTAAKLITVSGTDTITGTMSPTLTAYAAGQLFYFVAAGANTTTVTLNVDGLGAKAVTRDGSTALAAGDINSGEVVVVIYDGTRFQMINAANSFGNTTINGTLTVTGNTGLQANVSITSALSVGGVFAVTGNAGFQANVSITSALSVGGVFAVTGAATFTANPTLSGGTANGVLYLNGSKVATSGSNFTFDGTGTATLGTSTSKAAIFTGGASGLTIGAAAAPGVFVWDTTDASYVSYLGQLNESTYFGNNANGPLYIQTNATTRVTLDSSGNLGIGTSSPVAGYRLNVVNDSGNAQQLIRAGTNYNSTIAFGDQDSSTSGQLIYAHNGDYMAFNTNAAERMRIDAEGRVGIGGTANAFTKVDLLGTLPTSSNISEGYRVAATIPSGTTSVASLFVTYPTTQAASFTLGTLAHFRAIQNTLGAGSAITTQYGFLAESSLTGATNNYGFYSNIASGSNRWNFYAGGTAQNYFAGSTGVGSTDLSITRLRVTGAGATSATYATYMDTSGGTQLFFVRNDGVFNTGTHTNSPYNLTTASAANCFINSDGVLYRSTSSLRYKSNVANAAHGLADVLKLRSVTYKGKNDGDKTFGGLIAEEVHDAGLTEFVAYDKEGRPDALHYGNMVALLVKAVQELKAELDALKGA